MGSIWSRQRGLSRPGEKDETLIVPTLRVVMHPVTLRVTRAQMHCKRRDAERPRRHSNAERGNDHLTTSN